MSSRGLSTKAGEQDAKVLAGKRILIVEDSPVVAPYAADLLEELGCNAIGPAPTLAAARALIECEGCDAALLDVHIRGERVFSLCELLAARLIPFVLTSGYADWHIPEKWLDRPRMHKPYKLSQLEAALNDLLA
jgi:CheY-like chemotaxis protein